MPYIGLYIHPWHTYGHDILRGVARFVAGKPDWECFLPWPGSPDQHAALPAEPLDGLILRVGGQFDVPADFGSSYRRVVIANTDQYPADVDLAWDNRRIGHLAGEHLLEHGHRTILFVGQSSRYAYQCERAEGLAAVLADRRVDFRSIEHEPADHAGLVAILRDLPRPAAVFAATDPLGSEVLHAARALGRRVPDDLAVVSAGDNEVFCSLSSPPLSSVALPGEEVGYQAAARLERLLSGAKRPPPLIVPPRYVTVRRSSEALAIDDEAIAQVIRAIRSRAVSGLTVAEVRGLVPLSTRALEMRFKRIVGRTIEQEIRRVRLNRAKQLLFDTALPMADVAERSGFASAQRLSTVFAREEGHTPTAYRERSRNGQSR